MSRTILVIGAGRSSTSLINYLLDKAASENWTLWLADRDEELAKEKLNAHPHGKFIAFNALDEGERASIIPQVDLVVSMLPARFHPVVVEDCIKFKKNIITPSYISEEVKAMDEAAKKAGIIVLNEIGLDPGIDHMSALKVIDHVKNSGGKMTRFESFTGGLVAPESDNNPWNYKFTWNPRNVVLAGQGGAAQFLQYGKFKYTPYHNLFSRTQVISIDGYGDFEGYANRDSLSYEKVYGLEGIPTLYRGTLRRKGYCEAWNVFVRLGMTDDSYKMSGCEDMTYRQYVNSFLAYRTDVSVEEKLQNYLGLSDEIMDKLRWLDIFSDEKIGLDDASPAQILQKILEAKWSLEEGDKDMIVMWHKFEYQIGSETFEQTSSMVAIGEDEDVTGMANTVGLPIAIACKLILNGSITRTGVHLPKYPDMYLPILKELEDYGIHFKEDIKVLA